MLAKIRFEQIPIFPLNGAILFPESNLPLNIFEDRYLSMVDYALANKKNIGMIQSIKNKKNKLFKIGCVGKITSFSETVDGRYIINLFGVAHFEIIDEIKTNNKFRMCNVQIDEIKNNQYMVQSKNFKKNKLLNKFKQFFQDKDFEINFNAFEQIENGHLIKMMAMICPFTTSEKQMLLESKNINILEKNLLSLFDYYNNQTISNETIN